MRTHREPIQIQTRGRSIIDLTAQIRAAVSRSDIQTGLAHVFVHHTSASLLVSENADPDVLRDMETALLNGDWESFAVGCMRDSNSFHATCLDTMPPITYMYAHGLCPVHCARVDCGQRLLATWIWYRDKVPIGLAASPYRQQSARIEAKDTRRARGVR